MPALAPNGAGTAFTFLITFIAGLVTRTLFSNSTDLAQYQPNVVRIEYMTTVQTTTTTETFFSHSTASPTLLPSSSPFSTVVTDTLAIPKPGDLIPHPLHQESEARATHSTRQSEDIDDSFSYHLGVWIEILVEALFLIYQLLYGQLPPASYFSRPAVAVIQKDAANQTETNDTFESTIRLLNSKVQNLSHTIEGLVAKNLSLAAAKDNEAAKTGCLTNDLAELTKETEHIRQSVKEEYEENQEWLSNARRVQVKHNTEYSKRVAANDRKVVELKTQHEADIANLKAELQLVQSGYDSLQAQSLLQVATLHRKQVKATQDANPELEKSQKAYEELQRQSTIQTAVLKDLENQYTRETDILNTKLVQQQHSYDDMQKYWVCEVDKIYEEHEKDYSTLKAELTEQYKKQIDDLKIQVEMVQMNNDDLKRQKKELYAQFDELEHDLDDQGTRLRIRIDDQARHIQALDTKIARLDTAVKEKEHVIHSLQAKAAIRDRASSAAGNSRRNFNACTASAPQVGSTLRTVTNADFDSDLVAGQTIKAVAEIHPPRTCDSDVKDITFSPLLPVTPVDHAIRDEQQGMGSSTLTDIQSLYQRVFQPQAQILADQERAIPNCYTLNHRQEEFALPSTKQTFNNIPVVNNQSSHARFSHGASEMEARNQEFNILVAPPGELAYTSTIEREHPSGHALDTQADPDFMIPGLSYDLSPDINLQSNQLDHNVNNVMSGATPAEDTMDSLVDLESTCREETELDSAMSNLSIEECEPENANDEACHATSTSSVDGLVQPNIDYLVEQEASIQSHILGLQHNAAEPHSMIEDDQFDSAFDVHMHEDVPGSKTIHAQDQIVASPDASMQDLPDYEPETESFCESNRTQPAVDQELRESISMNNTAYQQQPDPGSMLNQEAVFEIPGLSYSSSGSQVDGIHPSTSDFAFCPGTAAPEFFPTLVVPTILPNTIPLGLCANTPTDEQNIGNFPSISGPSSASDGFLASLETEISNLENQNSFANTDSVQNGGGAHHTSWEYAGPSGTCGNTILNDSNTETFVTKDNENGHTPINIISMSHSTNLQFAAVTQYLNLIRSQGKCAVGAGGSSINRAETASIDPQLTSLNITSPQSLATTEPYTDGESIGNAVGNAGGNTAVQTLLTNLQGSMTLSDTYVPTEGRAALAYVTRSWTVSRDSDSSQTSAVTTANHQPAGGSSVMRRTKLKPKSRRRGGGRAEEIMFDEDLEDFE